MQCVACSSRDIYFDESGGQFTCTQCGLVLEENTIVSTIEFQETGDRSHVIGRHVSYTAAMSNSGGLYSGGYGAGNSRENTLAKAKIKIKAVADSVGNLVSTDLDMVGMAHQYYKLALAKNFLSGRKSDHVAVSCLYLICRKYKTDHLLIDFSDATQTNVYNLGKVFVQLIQILQEHNLPIIDPSLFIHRYAKKLELEDRLVKPVTISAMRIVTRMKKDWIVTGRRPDGVCAAAMLIATRAHGVYRRQQDIARLFRISTDTLRKRLQEFSECPVAQLSLDDFCAMSDKSFEELNESWVELDPPAYTRGLPRDEESTTEDVGSVNEQLPRNLRKKAFRDLYEDIFEELKDIQEEETLTESAETSGVPESSSVAAAKAGSQKRPLDGAEADLTVTETAEVGLTGEVIEDIFAEDEEVNACLLGAAEKDSRTTVWEKEFREVLNSREALRRLREAEEAAKGSRLTKSGKRRKVSERRGAPKESARQAAEDVLGYTRTSSKINYAAMGESFREDGSFRSPEEIAQLHQRSATSSSAAETIHIGVSISTRAGVTKEPLTEQQELLNKLLSTVEEEEEEEHEEGGDGDAGDAPEGHEETEYDFDYYD